MHILTLESNMSKYHKGGFLELTTLPEKGIETDEPEKIHSEFGIFWEMLKLNKLALFGLAVTIGLCLCAIFAPYLAPYDPFIQNADIKFQTPSIEHFFGTDSFGRDIFSRILYGSRVSLQIGLSVITVSMIIGTTIGAVSGYYGGIVDSILMRITDIVLAFPGLILAIGLMAALGQGINNLIIVMSLLLWTQFARVVRSETLKIRELQYVEAAKVAGASDRRIIFDHVIPNTLAPVIVLATLGIANAILIEASLSFIGLGIQPPTPSWGSMLNRARAHYLLYPHEALFPGLAITVIVLSLNLLGDGLRDALDPRLRI